MKFRNLPVYLLVFTFFLLLLSGCNDNVRNINDTITLNEANVREHVIPMSQAIEYTRRFRQNRAVLDSILLRLPRIQPNGIGNDSAKGIISNGPLRLINAEYFNRDAIAALLNQAGPDGGVRIYFGQDKNGVVKLVLVPATKDRDISTRLLAKNAIYIPGIQSANAAPFQEEEQAIERGQECPQMCPVNSELNIDK